MLPGITGWAQVNGRNDISWERKFELDVWYVDHVGLWLDLKILWLTVAENAAGRRRSAPAAMRRCRSLKGLRNYKHVMALIALPVTDATK